MPHGAPQHHYQQVSVPLRAFSPRLCELYDEFYSECVRRDCVLVRYRVREPGHHEILDSFVRKCMPPEGAIPDVTMGESCVGGKRKGKE